MLINEILIYEAENGLSISISINAKFAMHIDIYDKNGEVEENTLKWLSADYVPIAS